MQSPCSVIISKTECKPTGYNTDQLVSVSPGRLRWLENSWAVIDLSGLLIEINHQLAAELLYWAAISIYVGSGSVPDY